MKKIIFLLMLLIPINVFALKTSASSSILMEYTTKTILNEENAYEKKYPASMTKMMLLLLIMEKLENKEINLNDEVTISEYASSMGGSQVYLEAGKTYNLETLLKSIAVASANDSAVAVSEYIFGSVEETVAKMNEKVSSLKLKNTNFVNVHGLHDENHYSCAYDMAIIASELLKYEDILKYSSIKEDYVLHPNGNKTWIVNTNKLISYYEGLDGLKTGFTNEAGYCICATAKKNGMRLISVVMQEESNTKRNEDTLKLLNYGFSNYKLENILSKNDFIDNIDIKLGSKSKTKLILTRDVVDIVKKSNKDTYSYEVIKYDIKAPAKKNDIVGKVKLYNKERVIDEIDLTINEDIKKSNIFILYLRNLRKLIFNI